MPIPKRLPHLSAALLSCLLLCSLLSACASQPAPWMGGKPRWLSVAEVRRLTSCNSEEMQARLTLLPTVEAVETWQQAHKVDLIGVDPLPVAGAYLLAELGPRDSAGYGLAIANQAAISGGVLGLGATLFTPDPAAPPPTEATSPCVLVALPEGNFRAIELHDPQGKLLARMDAPAQ